MGTLRGNSRAQFKSVCAEIRLTSGFFQLLTEIRSRFNEYLQSFLGLRWQLREEQYQFFLLLLCVQLWQYVYSDVTIELVALF